MYVFDLSFDALADLKRIEELCHLRKLEAAGLLASRGAGRSTEYLGTEALLDRVGRNAQFPLPHGSPSWFGSLEKQRASVIKALAALVAADP